MPRGKAKPSPAGHGIQYSNSPYVCWDLGETKKPRFVLYDTDKEEIIARGNSPTEFDKIIFPLLKKKGYTHKSTEC